MRAETMRLLAHKGLSLDDIIEVAACEERRSDPTNAERQARHRARKRNGVTVTVLPPNDIDNSNPQGSAANAAGDVAADPVKELFDAGVALLTAAGIKEPQARSLIGKWRKKRSDGDVLTALLDCRARAISNPVEWLEKRFGGVKHVSASGHEYRGSDSDIIREAERRADWNTYYAMKNKADQPTGPPPKQDRRGGVRSIGQVAKAAAVMATS